ncbi:unnamed protein product [Clonostachys chloroleuca]|uniref:Probable succinyl-diaminopimelate desuccinylase n=1 Tax=Clonostachys chloroleuca TaxID=1926264 RepID=A0AA35Q0N0_9HYPO|nr:unnamed protein product [Clonostachys chloroleuca]
MSQLRRPILFRPDAKCWTAPAAGDDAALAFMFHQSLPQYQPSPLVSLDEIAEELGIGAVFVKYEGNRFDLPSFKILGASWGTFRVVCQKLGIGAEASLERVTKALAHENFTLYAATDGNHGRAVGRMGAILGIPVEIHIPASMHQPTVELIEREGARIVRSDGSYDDSIAAAYAAATSTSQGLFVQDTAFSGYEEIPTWIVQGYQTMLLELDSQLGGRNADLVICPVGVGSFAQAVVSHVKQDGRATSMVTVEPDSAACLWKCLRKDLFAPIETSPTIMAGLDCGTVSTTAWPLLQSGVDASLTVSDYESHVAVEELMAMGVLAGPCGASPLAALRRLSDQDKESLGLTKSSTVILLCTEGSREYNVPLDVSSDDPVALTQTLVQIDSSNPSLGSTQGPGETAAARYITHWLEHRDIENHMVEPTRGRPSIVGVVRGSGGGKSIMFNGHIDTVTVLGYDGDPLSGKIADGRLYGRGSADMKCGVAAAMVALARSKTLGLRGDVIFTGVSDEEAASIGTEEVLAAGWRADGAVVSEPTNLKIVNSHKGFVWVEVDIHGVAAHGSRADLGVDAICKAGYFLVALDQYAKHLEVDVIDPKVGPASVHASLIKGGEEASSYPARCTITIERRTIAGETASQVESEIRSLLEKIASQDAQFKYDLRVTFERSPYSLVSDHPFASLVHHHVGQSLGENVSFHGDTFWTDCALLADAGIPALLWGPLGEGLHAKEEWVDVASIQTVSQTLSSIAREFCS